MSTGDISLVDIVVNRFLGRHIPMLVLSFPSAEGQLPA